MLKKTGEFLDVIFEAGEDLYDAGKRKILLMNHSLIKLPVSKNRILSSYCHEFTGLTGLNHKTLRFLSLGRDINPEMTLNLNFLIKVEHTAEFNIKVEDPLKNSLRQMFNMGLFSDVVLNINNSNKIKAHKCLLTTRSQKFFAMFSSNLMEGKTNEVKI